MENYIDNGLVSEIRWKSYIYSLRNNNDITISDKDNALNILNEHVTNSVKKRVNNLDRFGVLFSGGIDSVLIAKICRDLRKDFTCYTIGFKDSKDIVYAKKAAKLLGLRLKVKVLTEKDVERTLINIIRILDSKNPVYVSIACVTYLALSFAKENNESAVLNGLGAEEIFCGYQRHLKSSIKEIYDESWRGLREMWKVDLERDYLI